MNRKFYLVVCKSYVHTEVDRVRWFLSFRCSPHRPYHNSPKCCRNARHAIAERERERETVASSVLWHRSDRIRSPYCRDALHKTRCANGKRGFTTS